MKVQIIAGDRKGQIGELMSFVSIKTQTYGMVMFGKHIENQPIDWIRVIEPLSKQSWQAYWEPRKDEDFDKEELLDERSMLKENYDLLEKGGAIDLNLHMREKMIDVLMKYIAARIEQIDEQLGL